MIAPLVLVLALADAEPRWIARHKPERGLWELGAFTGVFVVARSHDFYDPDIGYRWLRRAAPEVGLRAAYYPLSFLGVEGEFGGMWTSMQYGGGQPAFLYGLRLHGVLQLPFFRFAPFVLGGYGIGGVRSARDAVGNDVDPMGHYGIGLKWFVTRYIALRLEGRHVLAPAVQQRRTSASHGEVLFGVTVTLGRARKQQPERECPRVEAPAPAPEPAPEPEPDLAEPALPEPALPEPEPPEPELPTEPQPRSKLPP